MLGFLLKLRDWKQSVTDAGYQERGVDGVSPSSTGVSEAGRRDNVATGRDGSS
jgi:hypothetical protein